MSKKVIRLSESDLENIVKRVLQEEEATEQVVDRLKAKVAGGIGAVKNKQQNRKAFRKAKQDYIKTGTPGELPQGKNSEIGKIRGEFASLVKTTDRHISTSLKNLDRVIPHTEPNSELAKQDKELAAMINNYKDQLVAIKEMGKKLLS